MLVYLVERVFRDTDRPPMVVSVWASFERAQAWAERNRDLDGESDIAIRVQQIDPAAAAS